MNYEEMGFREQYNEILFSERDIIEKFLKDQYDIRYGRQRDTWHFEPAIEMMAHQGSTVTLTDIELNEDCCVRFIVDAYLEKGVIWECFDFAYGELSKVIEALPDVNQILIKNAVSDIARHCSDCSVSIENSPFNTNINGKFVSVALVDYIDGRVVAYNHDGEVVGDEHDCEFLVGLRNHIDIEVLHRSDEYKELMELLSLQENMRFECQNYGDATFVIDGTDMTFDVSSVERDDNGNLVIYGGDIDADVCDGITLTEKEIEPEYLTSIIECMKPKYTDIMDTYNAHNPELVRKINDAWKKKNYHERFGAILLAILTRDKEEFENRFNCDAELTEEFAYTNANQIMEGVCDDWDLETILSFIRYK